MTLGTVRSRSRTAMLIGGIALAIAATPCRATDQQTEAQQTEVSCNGRYKGGLKPSSDELRGILLEHLHWLIDGGLSAVQAQHIVAKLDPKLRDDPRRANLCDADLEAAHLEKAMLIGANLIGAHLNKASLDEARLDSAQLNKAQLNGAVLINTSFVGADLTEAHLNGAILPLAYLNDANLKFADLTGANLLAAHLNGANLWYATLSGAMLELADVSGTLFDIDPTSLPKAAPGLDTSQNLELVRFLEHPAGLVQLRNEFKALGLRIQESQLTYAIRRSELDRKDEDGHFVHSLLEREINRVFFEWTCRYGMSPGRPLIIVGCIAVLFTFVYVIAQCFSKRGSIWAVWEEKRIDKTVGSSEPTRLTGFPHDSSLLARRRIRLFLSVLMLGAYFSLLSALRIGWSGLNFGAWITRMQPREYSLHATGWVRFASGLQSLISVYFVALSILTYFGTPFEF